MTDNGAEDPKL